MDVRWLISTQVQKSEDDGTPNGKEAMARWEYRVLTHQATKLEEALNQRGAEGWEVVGTHFGRFEMRPHFGSWSGDAVQVAAVLKRPVP